jgi:hypothetical protein
MFVLAFSTTFFTLSVYVLFFYYDLDNVIDVFEIPRDILKTIFMSITLLFTYYIFIGRNEIISLLSKSSKKMMSAFIFIYFLFILLDIIDMLISYKYEDIYYFLFISGLFSIKLITVLTTINDILVYGSYVLIAIISIILTLETKDLLAEDSSSSEPESSIKFNDFVYSSISEN